MPRPVYLVRLSCRPKWPVTCAQRQMRTGKPASYWSIHRGEGSVSARAEEGGRGPVRRIQTQHDGTYAHFSRHCFLIVTRSGRQLRWDSVDAED